MLNSLADLLLPQDCVICAGPSEHQLVCRPCTADLPRSGPACPTCALPSPGGVLCGACVSRLPPFDRTLAAVRYAYPVDRLVQALKYNGQLPLAKAFAALLAERLPLSEHREHQIDLIVPVPLGPDRLRERGYNQALEIARHLGRRLGVPVAPEAARRVRATAAQADLAHDERARNVRGAFAVGADAIGRRIALVDDVMTTGSTLAELARTARAAGAVHIENWVVARAYRE